MKKMEMVRMILKSIVFSIAVSSCLVSSSGENEGEFLIRDGDKVVFYGDSITDTQYYPVLVETYVLTRYPAWRNIYFNRGFSGDNSGNMARFERDTIAQKPDVLTYNMGFNDGGYAKFASGQLEKFLANIEASMNLAREKNSKIRILLASPVPNELAVSKDTRWVSRETYPYTILTFGHEEGKLARKLDIPFVDTGLLYGQSMGLGQVAAEKTFLLSRDGVHPQREGQTLIAFHLLRGMGADPLVSRSVIDAEKVKVQASERCAISDLKVADNVVSFQRKDESLPYPTPPEAVPFAFLVRLDDNLSADMLTVTGLTAPSYVLKIDDRRIAEISSVELAQGVNLSRYQNTPMMEQSLAVMDAINDKQGKEMGFWRKFIDSGKADGTGIPNDKATKDDISAMDLARKDISDARERCYGMNTPKPHLFRLEPSQNKISRFDALENAELNQSHLEMNVTALNINSNYSTLIDKETVVTVTNSGKETLSGSINWNCPSGWEITPAETPFSVEAGKKQQVKFQVAIKDAAALSSRPEITMKWRWNKNWPYPLTITRILEVKPHLDVKHSTVKPQLSGNLDDWKDATSFVLDKIHFYDPAVPGKKLLWGGPSDLSAQIFLKWDETAFYVAALVRDDEHIQNANEMMLWSEDVLMTSFFMSEAGKKSTRYEFGFGARPDCDYIAHYYNRDKNLTGPDVQFKSKVDKEKGTCLYEVGVPWNRLPDFVPSKGKEFPFTLVIGEKDSQIGKGFNYLEWTPGINYGKNPADFAIIKLAE